eukprot:gene17598-23929_t
MLSLYNPAMPLLISDAIANSNADYACPACGVYDSYDGAISCDGCSILTRCQAMLSPNITQKGCEESRQFAAPFGGNGYIFSHGFFDDYYRKNPPLELNETASAAHAANVAAAGGWAMFTNGVPPFKDPMEKCVNEITVPTGLTGSDGILQETSGSEVFVGG